MSSVFYTASVAKAAGALFSFRKSFQSFPAGVSLVGSVKTVSHITYTVLAGRKTLHNRLLQVNNMLCTIKILFCPHSL